MKPRIFLRENAQIPVVDLGSAAAQPPGAVVATDDHALIRDWAAQHDAEPATGEATRSGPATVDVRDGGAGIRFNFPAAGMLRAISWGEWFQNFTQHDLVFVYEKDLPGRSPNPKYELVPRSELRKHQQGCDR